MRPAAWLMVLLIAWSPMHTLGQVGLKCYTSERLGNTLIKVGDSDRRVIEAEPSRVVRLETDNGGAAGYRLEFYKPERTVQFYISQGIVTRICSVRR